MGFTKKSNSSPPKNSNEKENTPSTAKDIWKTESNSEANAGDEARESEAPVAPMIKGLKVLIIGDTPRRREKFAKELAKYDIVAKTVTADEDGYRSALRFCPDVAISEMARPSDPGWWLLKRFQRHPSLKWTPTLLMKWWKEENGAEKILIKTVFDRLVESLAGIRVLEERISVGRKLNDQVETTGIPALINALNASKLSGILTVNDSWNVFNVELSRGKIIKCTRNGVDDTETVGDMAFFQLFLTDRGNWTFKSHDSGPRPGNITMSSDMLIKNAQLNISRILGPDVNITDSTFKRRLNITPSIFHDIASTFSGIAKDIMEAVAASVSKAEIETIIGDSEDFIPVEKAVITLLRSGAFILEEMPKNTLTLQELKASESLLFIIEWLNRDHRLKKERDIESHSQKVKQHTKTGYYSFKDGPSEKIEGDSKSLALSAPKDPSGNRRPDSSATVDLSSDDSWKPDVPMAPAQTENNNNFKNGSNLKNSDSNINVAKPKESFAPEPNMQKQNQTHMIIAIAVATALAALLVFGLILIGKS
ncbi:MAG: DUF4388 domain-containing protein [Deltaproteobacteria bacterium]|nr:DUF4388 domain-containing protein [Deltaproteobacteria bacterium]